MISELRVSKTVSGEAAVPVNVSVAGVQELRLVVDQNGNNNSDHADWAGARLLQGAVETFDNAIGYAGEYQDVETGFVYLRNRYYDPATRRFITEDPARDALNWYVYCGNNPINRVDPTGLESKPRYVNGTDVNFRRNVGINSEVIDILAKGTQVNWTGQKTEVIDGHQWAQVEWNGIIGWVAADYLGVAPVGVETVEPPDIQMSSMVIELTLEEQLQEVALDFDVSDYVMGPVKITGVTKHALAQILARDGGKGVSNAAILNAVKEPLEVVVQEANKTIKYIGENAVVVLNEAGKIITAWARNTFGIR